MYQFGDATGFGIRAKVEAQDGDFEVIPSLILIGRDTNRYRFQCS